MPGYLDGFHPSLTTSPLVDADGWVEDDLFWPAFLLRVGMATAAPSAFNADLADLDAYLDRFDDPDRWPVFAASVGGGTLYLVVRNFPGDMGEVWLTDDDVVESSVRPAQRVEQSLGGGPSLPRVPQSSDSAAADGGPPSPGNRCRAAAQAGRAESRCVGVRSSGSG
ncbi:hypothetical protein [Dactylosporangium sp. NPDC000521]|uniref:hypothetical protein n=1 Tax=Dactylosporangium sp. NPDC000521 TaxID=3363975 RepID=UPI0036CD5994